MSSLGAQTITAAELHVPPSGAWWADVTLESGGVPAVGPAVLVIADLVLVGYVLRSGVDQPSLPRAVVTGGAGWRTLLSAPGAYASASSVRLSTVLSDLAALAGEPYDVPAEALLGPGYGWDASTPYAPVRARDVLGELVVRGALPSWRVQPNGRTSFTRWPSTGAADAFAIIRDRNMAAGARYCAVPGSALPLLPGATLEGTTIARVTFTEDHQELRATTWQD